VRKEWGILSEDQADGGVEVGVVEMRTLCCGNFGVLWRRGDWIDVCFEGPYPLFFGQPCTAQLRTKQEAEKQNRHWPVTLMGVLSTVLLSAGVLRHYWDIYIHRTVRGISFIFVGIDAAGDVFSLISVCEYSSHDSM
jgi:hypothetical protein